MQDSSVKADINESKETRSANIRVIDGKYVTSFSVQTEDSKNGYSYDSYEKIFDTLKDYTAYLDKFLKL